MKNINVNFSRITIIFVIVLSLIMSSCALNKTPITAQDFSLMLNELGFHIVINEQQEGVIINSLLAVAPSRNYQIRFIEFLTQEQASGVFSAASEPFDQGSGTKTSFTGKNWASKTKTAGNEYGFISYIDTTFVMVGASTEYKQEILDIMKELGFHGKPSGILPQISSGIQAPADSTESESAISSAFSNEVSRAPAASREIIYNIGDSGPAGGIIFYDKGDSLYGWRYLEVAPAETEFRAGWGAYEQHVSGTETSIGTGKRNTEIIVEYLNQTGETGTAAQGCSNLVVNGFNDWFLSSSDELVIMHSNLHSKGLGGFSDAWDAWWWSSSQYDNDHVWYLNSFGGLFNNVPKPSFGSVRAVRSF